MKNNKILYLGWILFFASLFFRGCGNSQPKNEPTQINIPATSGVFESQKPNQVPAVKKMVIGQNLSKNHLIIKSKIDKLENDISQLYKENEILLSEFKNETDSLKRVILYQNAIAINKFSDTFEDENLLLNIEGIVRGEVQSITPNYTIKAKTIQAPVLKEMKFRMLAGVGIGNSLQFDKPLFNAALGFQNKKGNVLLGSFDTEKRISINYYQSIFTIKR
jgi:hypothetical protein